MKVSQDKLYLYISGELSNEESAEIQKAIEQDETLKADYLRLLEVKKALNQSFKAKAFEASDNAWQNNTKETKLFFTWRIAAGFIVLLGIATIAFWIVNSQSTDPQKLYADYFEPYPNYILESQRDISDEAIGADVAQAYSNANYDLAAKLLNEYKDSEKVMYYKGLCNLYLGNYLMSDSLFLTVKNEARFGEQARWYLALSYLKREKTHEALTVFTAICKAQSYKSKEACEIRKSLIN